MKKIIGFITWLMVSVAGVAQQYNVTATPAGVIKPLPNGVAVKGVAGGTSGQVQWNNAGSIAGFTATGDVTVVPSTGMTTISNNAVTNAKLAQMPQYSLKGNNTGSLANANDLGAASVKALLAITTADVSGLGSIASQNSNSVNISGGTIAGANVTGLAPPSLGTDAVNLNFVNSISAGITPRTGVAVASTANLTLSGEQTIDGVVTSASRVLVKNQTSTLENGIYVTAAGAWSRASDSNTAAQLKFGYYYFVSAGTTQAATSWFIATAPTVLNTDPVLFSQFSASQSYLSGTGLLLTGNTFSLNPNQTGLTIVSSAFNGTIGANTPSTIVATTETVTGNSYLGNVVVKSGQVNETATNATASLFLNYDGYNGGTTQFRDVEIMDGKNAQVAKFTGSTKALAVNGALNVTGQIDGSVGIVSTATTPYIVGNSASIGTVYYGSIGANSPVGVLVNNATIATFSSSGLTMNGGAISVSTNANIRTTKSNLNLLVNVKDYGALGDGSTNDTSAIASAATAANSAHGVLYFPPGNYITDAITITGATGLSICGDGIGISVLKRRVLNSSGGVLNISSSNHVTTSGLTFDGNCNTRTSGGQAVIYDASQSSFNDCEIINSGEYAFFAGSGATTITNLSVYNPYIHACYADGINFQNVTKSVINNPRIDGADDDLIAIGFNGSGAASEIAINGGVIKSRNDLGTTWGRGLAIIGASHVTATGLYVSGVKQHGLYIAKESGSRPTDILISGCTFKGNAIASGHNIAIYETTDVSLVGVQSINPLQGSLCEIADWRNLTIQGGQYTNENNVFGRGIHADESAGWAASWTDLRIIGPSITMDGASTNSCVYLVPDSSVTMNTGTVSGVTGSQVVAGDYITVSTARMGTLWKIGNNTTLTASRTVSPSSSAGVYTVFNNN